MTITIALSLALGAYLLITLFRLRAQVLLLNAALITLSREFEKAVNVQEANSRMIAKLTRQRLQELRR